MIYPLDSSNRLKNLMKLASNVEVSHVELAIKKFNSEGGSIATYRDSTGYDLKYKEHLYPPKAIFGLALSYVLGEEIQSSHFSGGLGSECFKTLDRLNFEIVSKAGESIKNLEQDHSEDSKITQRPIILGNIPGIEKGHWFKSRKEMMPSSFHRIWTSGIDGNGSEGAAAIVLSGGYTDDQDYGNEIIYTGAGGNKNGQQVADQSWKQPGNAGLLASKNQGLPVRVIRGYQHTSKYSPTEGYLYAGLYRVVDAWEEKGKHGFKICRFLLSNDGLEDRQEASSSINSTVPPERRLTNVLRIIRDSNVSRAIKKLYDYKCQVCNTAIPTKNGLYAEGAHIKPLGRPHNGDDKINNLLCLCPNHHVMFDAGVFAIADTFKLLGQIEYKSLIVHPNHEINLSNFLYHRETHGYF